MNFHLTFSINPLSPSIRYSDKILLMGSCFAEEMGTLLDQHKLHVTQNPHGILYNPLSITNALHSYLDGKLYTEADLFQHDDWWHSWDHHSRFSAYAPAQALEKINEWIFDNPGPAGMQAYGFVRALSREGLTERATGDDDNR